MSLVKRTYVDQVTVITAENLNAIQDAIIEDEGVIEGKYNKPAGGIPATDLASAVQTSLGKADTALQSSDIDSTLAVTGKAADAKKTGDEISGLKNTLNHKADVIYDTASGDIASFPDGAEGLPVKDLTVAIEPVQDLHGYENPWPAGGGKNLIALNKSPSRSQTVNVTIDSQTENELILETSGTSYGQLNLFYLLPAGTYTLQCKATSITGTYTPSVTARFNSFVYTANSNTPTTFTLSDETEVDFRFNITETSEAAKVRFYDVQLEAGSSATSYAPYSNICPISGWTGANVTRVGENFSTPNIGEQTIGSAVIDVSSDGITTVWPGDHDGTIAITLAEASLTAGQTYYLTGCPANGSNSRYSIDIRPINVQTILASDYGNGVSYTPDSNMTIRICLRVSNSLASIPYMKFYPCLSLENNGTTLPISWQSSAGTVYGGTLDVTTGVLTVDRAMQTFDGSADETIDQGGWASGFRALFTLTQPNSRKIGDVAFNMLKTDVDPNAQAPFSGKLRQTDNRADTYWVISDVSTLAQFRLYLSNHPLQICYGLASPATYQLTPQEVTTLLGQNNIWADCGPSTVEYPCDTKLYIDKKLAALVAALS